MDIGLQLPMLLWISIWISLDFYGYPCIDLQWILDPGKFVVSNIVWHPDLSQWTRKLARGNTLMSLTLGVVHNTPPRAASLRTTRQKEDENGALRNIWRDWHKVARFIFVMSSRGVSIPVDSPLCLTTLTDIVRCDLRVAWYAGVLFTWRPFGVGAALSPCCNHYVLGGRCLRTGMRTICRHEKYTSLVFIKGGRGRLFKTISFRFSATRSSRHRSLSSECSMFSEFQKCSWRWFISTRTRERLIRHSCYYSLLKMLIRKLDSAPTYLSFNFPCSSDTKS